MQFLISVAECLAKAMDWIYSIFSFETPLCQGGQGNRSLRQLVSLPLKSGSNEYWQLTLFLFFFSSGPYAVKLHCPLKMSLHPSVTLPRDALREMPTVYLLEDCGFCQVDNQY